MAEMDQEDSMWEYVAPQFVDFSRNPLEDNDNADAWFDAPSVTVGEGEQFQSTCNDICSGLDIIEDADQDIEKPVTPKTESRRLTRSFAATPTNEKGLPEATDGRSKAHETPGRKTQRRTRSTAGLSSSETKENTKDEKNQAVSTESTEESKVSNICTDLSLWREKTKSKSATSQAVINDAKSQPARVKKQPGMNPVSKKSPHQMNKVPKVPEPAKSSQTVTKPKQPETSRSRRSGQDEETRGRSTTLKRSASIRRSADCQKLSNSTDEKSTLSQNTNLRRSGSMKRSNSLNFSNSSDKKSSSSLDRNSKRSHTRALSNGRASSSDRQTRQRVNSNNSDTREGHTAPASKVPRLTCPSTPTFMKRKPVSKVNGEQVKKTEEKELETIAYLRSELAKKRKMAQESYKKAMTANACLAVHSHKEPTKPQEFQFETDTRIKSTHSMETRSESRQKDFAESLRSSSSAQTSVADHKGPTIPHPFKLTDCRKRKMGSTEDLSSADTFHSMAEKVKAFHRQTPDRFRTKSRVDCGTGGPSTRGRSRSPPKGMTIPKTPNFETRSRTRSYHIPSQLEKEEEEVEEMQKNQFKAHPVNERILTNPNTGIRKVPSKPLTEPKEFHLSSDRRVLEKDNSKEEDNFEFHAKPVPKKILEGTVGVKLVKPAPPTIPKSPAFALKNRVRMPVELEESQTDIPGKIKANPVPHSGVPFQPKLGHKSTMPEPFTFEERDKILQLKKEEKIKEILEEEKKAREFRAQGLPSPTSDTLPAKQPKPVTRPQPFQLEVDSRGAKRAEEWSRKMEEDLRQQRHNANFKAQGSDVLHKEPFIPQKSSKPLTDINDFELNTDKRSKARETYEQAKKAQEAKAEALKRQREKRQEEEEKAAIAKLRSEMVHKSNPIKRFANVEIQPSDRPATVPLSPKFSTDSRLRSKVRV